MDVHDWKFCPRCGGPLKPRSLVDGDRERRVCLAASCGFVAYDNPTPVVAALVEHGGHAILVRNHGWPETWYGLVSGFLERDESPEAGMLREIREELDLSATLQGLIGVYPFPERNELILAYHALAEGAITPGPELAGIKRVPLSKLRPWPFGTGQAVADWLKSRQGPAPD